MSNEKIKIECLKVSQKWLWNSGLPSEACVEVAEKFYKWVKPEKTHELDPDTDRYLNAARTK